MKKLILLLLSMLSFAVNAANSNAVDDKQAKAKEWFNNQPLEFIENKGQFANSDGKPADNVLFKASYGNCDIYITDKGLSYVFRKSGVGSPKSEVEDRDNHIAAQFLKVNKERKKEYKMDSCYRLDMNLEGAVISKSHVIKEDESRQGHHNYFYAHCPQGIYDVKGYGKITIKNIYKGIDWVIYTNQASKQHPLKYDFVVHPGADYKNIKIKFLNARNIILNENDSKLKIETIAGNIEEGNLHSLLEEDKTEVQSKYKISADTSISFEMADYDASRTLIIDPLVWATYYGGYGQDEFISITVDKKDNISIAGHNIHGYFPLYSTSGAFIQNTNNGYFDLEILKFDNKGKRLWSTYFGGSGDDRSRSICSDSKNNIYIAGETASVNFPTKNFTGAYYQPNIGGIYDLFILKFDDQGILCWSTYYGGNNDEGTSYYDDNHKVICVDHNDNLYLTGTTQSQNFPTQQLSGAYWQANNAGGTISGGDVFI